MYTASEKKRENIAEYILYMWQIEDLIRAYNLDIDRIDSEIIAQNQNLTDTQKRDPHEWYESLIDMMRREGVEKQGQPLCSCSAGDALAFPLPLCASYLSVIHTIHGDHVFGCQ